MNPLFDLIAGPVVNIVKEVVDRQVVDKAGAERIKDEINKSLALAAIQGQLAQVDVNKEEAKSTNWFVAGGRPFIIWVCGSALAYNYVLAPISVWLSLVVGHPIPSPPILDDNLWQLMAGLLGMSGWRTFEKIKGVAR